MIYYISPRILEFLIISTIPSHDTMCSLFKAGQLRFHAQKLNLVFFFFLVYRTKQLTSFLFFFFTKLRVATLMRLAYLLWEINTNHSTFKVGIWTFQLERRTLRTTIICLPNLAIWLGNLICVLFTYLFI